MTGASAGIGWALAVELAAGGANLVLTARRRERLEQLASQLRSNHEVRVVLLTADLAQPSAPQEIFAFTQGKGIAVDLLVNNAGFGAYGEFPRIPLAHQFEMLQVNITAVLHLTYLYLPAMIERRRGNILIVSSTAAFQAVPYISTYAATKAFDLVFAEALAEEMRPYGIRVCALCPGSTSTEFHQVRSREWVCARWRGERAASSPAWVTTSVHKCSDWCRAAWSLVSRRACFAPRHSIGACSLRLCVCSVKVVFRLLKNPHTLGLRAVK